MVCSVVSPPPASQKNYLFGLLSENFANSGLKLGEGSTNLWYQTWAGIPTRQIL